MYGSDVRLAQGMCGGLLGVILTDWQGRLRRGSGKTAWQPGRCMGYGAPRLPWQGRSFPLFSAHQQSAHHQERLRQPALLS